MFRSPGSRGWARAPGRATALGDGWVLCTDRHTGGYGIYRWSSYCWVRMPGAAVLIGGSYHQPWVINDRNIRYVWNGHDWREAGIATSNRFNSRDQYSRFDKQNDERFHNQDDRWDNNRKRDDRSNRRDDPPRRNRW